jgi:alpha-methylacyl-CoA racemase
MMRTAAGAAAIPANLVADFAGGGLMAAFAIMTALWARSASGGQHIDMAMTDGAMYLAASQFSRTLAGEADAEPGGGRLTGGNPNYQVYECADGQLLAVAPVEPGFWRRVAEAVGLPHLTTPADSPPQARSRTSELARVLRSRDRASWLEIIGAEASCVSPVLSLAEAIAHPNATARDMVVIVHDPDYGAIPQIGIGPKLSATPGAARTHSARPGEHTDAILRELGRSPAEIRRLVDTSAVSRRTPRTVSADER